MLAPLFALAMMLLSADKPAPTPFTDGVLVSQGPVKTGEMDCENDGSHSHCTPSTVWIYRVRLAGEELPLKPVDTKKSVLFGIASGGVSETLRKKSVLWPLMMGDHFEYRQEGRLIRIRKGKRESLYEIYLGH